MNNIRIASAKTVRIYLVFLSILLSGSVYFSLLYTKETRLLFFGSVLVIFFINVVLFNKKISLRKFYLLLLFIFVIWINHIINIGNGTGLSNLLYMSVLFGAVYMLSELVPTEKFAKAYVNVLIILSILSLIFYTLTLFISMGTLPFFKYELLGTFVFSFSFYHSWGWGDYDFRNHGVFWEPGAFQCYVNLALLFVIFDKKNNFKNKKTLFILFIITILTTQSTTGYLVTATILIYSIITSKIKIKNSIYKFTIYFLLLLSIFFFSTSNVVIEKFESDNGSLVTRSKDFTESIELISKNWIKGLGYNSELFITEQQQNGIERNSNGLLIFLIQFGMIPFILYIIFMYLGIKNTFNTSLIDTLFIHIIFLVFMFTEPIVFYPVWIYFLFSTNR